MIAEQETDRPKPIAIGEAIAAAVQAGLVRVVTGKRRERPIALRAGAREDIPIPVVTATALKLPGATEINIKNLGPEWDNRIKDDKVKEAERRDAVSVAMAQPHRHGGYGSLKTATRADSDFARLSTPLGRFCAIHARLKGCYEAGDEYDKILRRAKAARGFVVPDVAPGENPDSLTEEEIEAARQAAIAKEIRITGLLRTIMARAPRVMEKLCYDKLDPAPNDTDLITHCLIKLGLEFNLVDLGINREKAI